MSSPSDRSSSAHPWVQANRSVAASRGEVLLDQIIEADLGAIGLPPTGLALIGGATDAGVDQQAALEVAVWLATVIKRAGLSEVARELYEIHREKLRKKGEHTFRAPELAARELARRVLDVALHNETQSIHTHQKAYDKNETSAASA